MLVKEDDGVYYCPWWRNGDNIANFDDMSDTVLVNAMRDNGFVVALTYDSLDEITVNLQGETAETLVWSNTEKEFNKRIPVWQNAQANMVYRAFTWQDNTNIFAVIDDNSGELCVWTDDENHTFYFKVTPDNYNGATVEFERLADHPEMETQVTGLYDIEVFECSYDGWGDTVTIANETDDGLFIVKVDQDGYYRTGSAEIPKLEKIYRRIYYNEQIGFDLWIFTDAHGRVYYSITEGTTNKVGWSLPDSVIESADGFAHNMNVNDLATEWGGVQVQNDNNKIIIDGIDETPVPPLTDIPIYE